MKLFAVMLCLVALFSYQHSNAQCDADKHKNKCVSQLASGFTFIKSYLLNDAKENDNGEIEYSFVFSSGTLYMLTFANSMGMSDNIEIKLYSPSKKLVASNYDKKNNKFRANIGYKCAATGVYYMTFKFKDAPTHCGLSVLGFKRG